MDKLKTSDLGGFPFVLDDIRQFLGRLTSPANHGIYQAFNNILRGFGENFIVQGVVLSGSTGAFSITEGWILLGGELIKVDAQGPFDEAVDGTFTKVTTFDPRGNKDFLNGSNADTYEKNRGVLSGLGGSLAFDANTFFDLKNQADFRDATPAEAGIITLKKKVIEIGDWDMDTDVSVIIVHGLATGIFRNVRRVEAMIRNDADSVFSPLDSYDPIETDPVGGGVSGISSLAVILSRSDTGKYDDTDYDSTSFNRGWITIEYES